MPLSENQQKSVKDVWDGELRYAESLISDDVRNNSAWTHRFFVAFENDLYAAEDIINSELEYTWDKIKLVPNNASAWNYLRGCGTIIVTTNAKLNMIGFGQQRTEESRHATLITASAGRGPEDINSMRLGS